MVKQAPDNPSFVADVEHQTKGLLKDLYEGLRTLVIIDDKLTHLGKEADISRQYIHACLKDLSHLIGTVDQMEKRFLDRLSDIDKRFSELDKRIDLTIDSGIREQMERNKVRRTISTVHKSCRPCEYSPNSG